MYDEHPWGGDLNAFFPYLDYSSACAGGDDSSTRADVECIVPISTGPDDIDDKVLVIVLDRCFEGPGTEHISSHCEVFLALLYPLDMRRSKEGTDLRGRDDIGCKEMFEGEFEVVRGEMLGRLDELFQ